MCREREKERETGPGAAWNILHQEQYCTYGAGLLWALKAHALDKILQHFVSSILSSLLGGLLFHQHWLQFPAHQPQEEADVAVRFINSLWGFFYHSADNKVWSCKSQSSKLWSHLHQVYGLPRWLSGKKFACSARGRRWKLSPFVRKIPF